MALVQEGPSVSLMACKYTCVKETAIPLTDSMSVYKPLERAVSVTRGMSVHTI